MPYCYYTCNLLPLELLVQSGYSPRWLGDHLRDAAVPARRDSLSVHPMTCPYVTKLVAAADALLGGASDEAPRPQSEATPGAASGPGAGSDCLVVPGGCDAMRRLGDLFAATYPGRVFVLSMPRSSGPEGIRTLGADLGRLENWLRARLPGDADGREDRPRGAPEGSGTLLPVATGSAVRQQSPHLEYPAAPQPGGAFLVAGPLSDDSLLRLVGQLGANVAGLESCTSPDRWKPLAAVVAPDHEAVAAKLLEIGMCPRRSTADRRDHLVRRLDETRPSSIIYARQSFCDPGAYDALLVSQLAQERGLPYLEIEVDFPFDAGGPLRTRVEAFLEAQLLDDDLLEDFVDDDLFDKPTDGNPPEED